jgi:hypothetical protein
MLTLTAAVLAAATAAMGQPASQPVAIQERLNQKLNLSIPDAPIGEVFAKLEKATGVRLKLSDDAAALLPYGKQTHMSVTLANVTLRDALTRMLAESALRWMVEGDSVVVWPNEALYRTSRRATFEELQTLGRLQTRRLTPPAEGGDITEMMRKESGNNDLKLVMNVPDASDEMVKAAVARANRVLPGTAAEWLDMLAGGEWTWYLSGNDIIVVTRARQVERQLARQVTLRYQNEKLATVILDLARQARVKVEMEPGVLNALPVEVRNNFTLIMADATIAQALEVISGTTGLAFERLSDGLRVTAAARAPGAASIAQSQPTTAPAGTGKKPFLVRLNVPVDGKVIEVFMRSDELPDDVVEAIEAGKAKFIQEVRAARAAASQPR